MAELEISAKTVEEKALEQLGISRKEVTVVKENSPGILGTEEARIRVW